MIDKMRLPPSFLLQCPFVVCFDSVYLFFLAESTDLEFHHCARFGLGLVG